MLWYYIYMPASATSKLISSHRGLVFRTSAAQRANGGYIVRAFAFTPRGTHRLGVCDPEGSNEFYILNAISNIIVSWEWRSNIGDGLGHKRELTELGTKPVAQQDINISFRHTSYLWEDRGIRKRRVSVLADKLIQKRNNKARKKRKFVSPDILLNFRNINCWGKKEHRKQLWMWYICSHLFCQFWSSRHVAAEDLGHLGCYITLPYVTDSQCVNCERCFEV